MPSSSFHRALPEISSPVVRRALIIPLALLLGACCSIGTYAETASGASNVSASTAQGTETTAADPWWKHAVVYEIYPRSFQDSNGDGVGDLNGITERLGYLEKLGIDAIWIAPMYPSPQVDFGYDISNYETVDPQYGTLQDFDKLVTEAKKHNIRVVLDMVLNHTSDKHQWFVDASSSRTNPKHNWYVWSDGKPGTGKNAHDGMVPPNNWVSGFGGSAWEWVPAVHQFYYHMFYKQQPDLNWRNPEVEKAMFDSMRFWLDRGVAGFRLDAIPTLFEDPELHDERELGGVNAQGDPNLADDLTNNLPEVHDVIRRMRAMVAKYPCDRVLIGETYLPNTAELDKWYGGAAKDELNLPMDMLVGFQGNHAKLDASVFRKRLDEVETQVHGSQPLLVFDNHDNIRSIDRYGDGVHNEQISKLLATMLFTARAAALMYYGEELGMPTTTPTRREDVKDPIGITGWPKEKGRDGERTPMQWTAGPQAGFSTNPHTWLPIPPSYKTTNVAVESTEPDSQLNWFKRLIELRRDNPALRNGKMTMLDVDNPDVLSYVRFSDAGGAAVVVAMNFTSEAKTISLDLSSTGAGGSVVKTLATDAPSLQSASNLKSITLPPFASWIASVQ
jgi:alpha-glucosidase